ncbi:MAG: SUF system NifU family Fe-S cluster assembly protein [Acidimicrobiia bacterium]|nr:MAG: SUF system NifU family Fe-S cluster assembly protein [Acidimicrobiia bacterium]
MSLDDLYRQVILDHYRSPRRAGRLDHPDAHADGSNPLCGDELSIDLAIDGGTVTDVRFTGRGCSISQASASMMADRIVGQTLEEVTELSHRVKRLLDIEPGEPGIDPDRPGAALGDIEALAGVRRFPVRIKCADLPWTTLMEALGGDAGTG